MILKYLDALSYKNKYSNSYKEFGIILAKGSSKKQIKKALELLDSSWLIDIINEDLDLHFGLIQYIVKFCRKNNIETCLKAKNISLKFIDRIIKLEPTLVHLNADSCQEDSLREVISRLSDENVKTKITVNCSNETFEKLELKPMYFTNSSSIIIEKNVKECNEKGLLLWPDSTVTSYCRCYDRPCKYSDLKNLTKENLEKIGDLLENKNRPYMKVNCKPIRYDILIEN